MQLWNDYEGRTIAEAYPLTRLLRPEGRSAFFLTTNGTGMPAMVRVIEAHFDESEILSRWRLVSEITQENLVAMRKFGQTELDGTPLVYAVMEPTEISLAELLENRTLTVDEAKQLATSLVAALTALHERGLIHEHVEPANILAAGETVKLRSDCVRAVVTDPEMGAGTAAEQRARDAHAVAMVLLRALTGRTSLQGSATLLPSPFDGIIRNGLSGKWGLAEMAAALGTVKPAEPAAATAKPAPKPDPVRIDQAKPMTSAATTTAPAALVAKTDVNPAADVKTAASVPKPMAARSAPDAKTDPATVAQALASMSAAKAVTPAQAPDVRHRIVRPIEEDPRRRKFWVAAAIAVVLLLFFFWRIMRSEPTSGASAAAKPITTLSPVKTGEAPPPADIKPTVTVRPIQPESPAGVGRTQWRVVAYTFNHQNQAQEKADSLAKRDPSLNPEVFTPNGHAPYLVTVGGPMTREQAEAFKHKARSAGLPRDLYAQNYAR